MSGSSWETWVFVLNVTLPNVLMLLFGVFLQRTGLVDDRFCDTASKIVFNFALPSLLFFSVATDHTRLLDHLSLAIFAAVSTFLSYLLLEILAGWLVKNRRERGIFVQGGFRSNTAIFGMAYAISAFGEQGVAIGSIYLTITVILFNILSVITLSRSLTPAEGVQGKTSWRTLLRGIVTNPLIIGLSSAVIYSQTQLPLPEVVEKTGTLLGSLALPLALICTGATLDLRALGGSSQVALWSSLFRVLIVPAGLAIAAWLWGFKGVALGVIFLFSSSPTAASSYIMTRAMGGNATLAANIIAITTVGSFFSTVIGLYFLRSWGLI